MLKNATKRFMQYLETPLEEKQKKREQKLALKRERNRAEYWFGAVPFLLKYTFRNKKSS